MKKMTQVVLSGVLFLSTIVATAQISTRTGGATNVLANIPNTNTNVGIGTKTPKSNLDIKGNLTVGSTYAGVTAAPVNGAIIEGNVGIGTTSTLAKLEVAGFKNNTQIFVDEHDAYKKCVVLNIGGLRETAPNNTSPGYRLLTFMDVPVSNVTPARTWFGIDDRNDSNRLFH